MFQRGGTSGLNEHWYTTTQHMDANNLRGKKNRKFDLKFKLAVVKYAGRRWPKARTGMETKARHLNYLSRLSIANGLSSHRVSRKMIDVNKAKELYATASEERWRGDTLINSFTWLLR